MSTVSHHKRDYSDDMDEHEFIIEHRGPTRVLTPEMDSDEDLMAQRGPGLSDRIYRLFNFRKETRSWANPLCTESTMDESEIRKRARRPKKHPIEAQLEKMSIPRRNAIYDLLNRTNQRDQDGRRWDILAIDNDQPEITKRKGEVLAFSVILAREDRLDSRSRSGSQDQRRSSFVMAPQMAYAVPAGRNSKQYHPRQSPARENRGIRQNQNFRNSNTIFEDDPFGSTELFSYEGKPLDPHSAAPLTRGGMPAHIPADDPIGLKVQLNKERDRQDRDRQDRDRQDRDRKTRSRSIQEDTNVNAMDKLMADLNMSKNDDILVGPFDDLEHDFEQRDHEREQPQNPKTMPGYFEMDESTVIVDNRDERPRGRKLAERASAGDKDARYGLSHSRDRDQMKTKPGRPSLHIPDDEHIQQVQEILPGDRRRQTVYWSNRDSVNALSDHSEQSVLEGEMEMYSSSASSLGHEPGLRQRTEREQILHDQIVHEQIERERAERKQTEREQDWAGAYKHSNGRYTRGATRSHRAGPPSPQQPRYADLPDSHHYTTRPRRERYPSDGAITRYTDTPASATTSRPPLVAHYSTPRFTPSSAHPYTYDSGLVPYPHETQLPRRRESSSRQQSFSYREERADDLRDREIEALQRENERLRREADLNRRASVRTGRFSKYNHEPRLDRRYTGGDVPTNPEQLYYR